MAVSRRLRFEIMRRDQHRCRYCGASAPEATLTIDHVVPVTLGGTDDPSNLVTACAECNAGKSSVQPDADTVAEINMDSTRWEQAKRLVSSSPSMFRGFDDELRAFAQAWLDWSTDGVAVPLDSDWQQSVRVWLLRGLPVDVIVSCVTIAMRRQGLAHDDVWRYFCGVCWKKVREFEEQVEQTYRRLSETDPGPPFDDAYLSYDTDAMDGH